MEKRVKEGCIVGGILAANALQWVIIGAILSDANKNSIKQHYAESPDRTSISIIINGQLYTYNNPEDVHFMPDSSYRYPGVNKVLYEYSDPKYHGGIGVVNYGNPVEYEIQYIDDKTMIIYTYNEDEKLREVTKDYIVSNIKVDEDNNIIFHEGEITQEGFEKYQDSVNYQSSEEETLGTQRTRSLEEV